MISNIKLNIYKLSAAYVFSYIGYNIRINNDNKSVQEIGATLETFGHAISYVLSADAIYDTLKHMANAELIVRTNPFRYPLFITPPNTTLVEDTKHSFIGSFTKFFYEYFSEYNIIIEAITPAIVGFSLIKLNNHMPKVFNAWKIIADIPEYVISSRLVSITSFAIFNVHNIPLVGDSLDNYFNNNFSKIEKWAIHPGGDTVIGTIYRDYILETWELVHAPYHFYEAICSIDSYYKGETSPLIGELNNIVTESI